MLINQPVFSPGSLIRSNPKRASIWSANWLRSSRLRADIEDPSSLFETNSLNSRVHSQSRFAHLKVINSRFELPKEKKTPVLTGFPDLPHFVPGPLCTFHCFGEPCFSSSVDNNTNQQSGGPLSMPHLQFTLNVYKKVALLGFSQRRCCCFPILARFCSNCRESRENRDRLLIKDGSP